MRLDGQVAGDLFDGAENGQLPWMHFGIAFEGVPVG